MNEQNIRALYNRLNFQNKVDYNTFKADLINNPANRRAAYKQAGLQNKVNFQTFESDLLGTVNQPIQQERIVTKSDVKQEEEQSFFSKAIDKVTNFFTEEEEQTPQQKINNQVPVTVNPVSKSPTETIGFKLRKEDIPDVIPAKTKTNEVEPIGANPNFSYTQQISQIEDKYNDEKILNYYKDKINYIQNETLSTELIPVLQKELQEKLRQNKINRNLALNKLNAQSNNNKFGLVADETKKNELILEYKNGIIGKEEKLKNLSKQNEFLNLAKETNVLEKPISGTYNLIKNYIERKSKINEAISDLEVNKKALKYLQLYNIDPIEALKEIQANDNLNQSDQFASAYDKSIIGNLESVKKFFGREDETTFSDLNKSYTFTDIAKKGKKELDKLLSNLVVSYSQDKFSTILSLPLRTLSPSYVRTVPGVDDLLKEKIAIKNLTSDQNKKEALEKTLTFFTKNIDFKNEGYKNALQNKIAANGWQDNVNVFDNKFDYLVENYNNAKNNPTVENLNNFETIITNLYKNPEDQQKIGLLIQDFNFKKIADNVNALNNLNGTRIGQNLKAFTQEKIDNLESLKTLKNLNERQQIAQDILEQQSDESGLFSVDRVKFLLQQMSKASEYTGQYTDQYIGTLGTYIKPDSENLRKVEYSAGLWKGINFAQDEGNISLFDKGVQWVNIKADKNNNYQVSFNDLGQVVDIKANDMSLSVRGPQRQIIENYFYNNSSELKKQAGDIYSMPGGHKVVVGGLLKTIGVVSLEEAPTIALEAGATAFTEGAAAPLLEASLIRLGTKALTAAKFTKNFKKVAGQSINFISSVGEISHDVKKNYEDRGLDPGLMEVFNVSGAMSGVGLASASLENKYRKLGSDLIADGIKKEAKDVFIKDLPKVIKSISSELVNIKDKKYKDYLFNKELRNYAVARFSDRALSVVKAFKKEGFQEASEETILEPMAQVLANYANASLTGNEEYNRENLQDLGFLDPETALIAGLAGGVMSSSVNVGSSILNKSFEKDNGLNTIDALNAAVKDPNKFKSLLSTFIDNKDAGGNSLTTEKYNSIIQSFDNVKNNFEQTKKDFNLDQDFISKLDFENPLHKNILESFGININNIEQFNGNKTFDNIILNSELNKINKEKAITSLAEALGIPNNNNQLDLTPYLDENKFFDFNKYNQIVGKDTIDEITQKNIKDYNQIVAKEKNITNLINLFNKNLGPIQNEFKTQYQTAIENNSELLNPDASFIRNIYQENLFNKLTNIARINSINSSLETGLNVVKNKALRDELKELNRVNKSIDDTLNNITNTYKNGYFAAQETMNSMDEEFNFLDIELKNKLNEFISLNDTSPILEEREAELNNLITNKENQLKKIKKAHKEYNKNYNNSIKSLILDQKAFTLNEDGSSSVKNKTIEKDLEESIKKDRETIKKIKKYNFLYNKFKTSSLTKKELDEFRKFNKKYDNSEVLKIVLPYFVSLNKEEIEAELANDNDLTLSLFNNLVNLGYINFDRLGKNINPELILTKVQNALLELNYNIALINDNRLNEIKLFTKQNGALYVNTLINKVETDNKEKTTSTVTPDSAFENIQKPTIKGSTKQEESLNLLQRNSIKRSALPAENITDKFYIIDNKLYQRVTTVEEEEKTSSEYLTAGSNVGNFLDNVGRIIFGNNNINETHKEEIFNTLINNFANKNVELSIDKEKYNRMFKFLLDRRNDLISKGYIFVTDERVIYSKYDGTDFTGIDAVTTPDNTVGIAGTMDIIAIAPDGKIDVLDLKSVSDNKSKANTNASNYKKTKWAKQLGIYKTILEKIPGISVNNLKVLRFNVTYDILNLGNKIINLNFKESSLENIFLSPTLQNTINKYLSIPSLIIATNPTNVNLTPEIPLVSDNDDNIVELPNEVNDLLFFEDFSNDSEIPQDQIDYMNYIFNEEGNEQVDPVIETIPFFEDEEGFEYDPNDYPFIETPQESIEKVLPISDKKADIERRRQEGLKKFGTSEKETSKNGIKVLGVNEYVSRELMELAYSNDSGNNPKIGGAGQSLDRIIERGGYSKEELLQLLKPEIDKINAKYDAELAALQPTTTTKDIEAKRADIEKLKNEQKNIKREDININIQINEKGSKDYPDGHSIGASFNFPDLRETLREITFKRENRNSVQNSVVEKENIGNEKIKFYNFGRFNPDFTNDPGVFGFSINFKDNTIELSKNQINKINDLIQDITDNYAKLGNRYTLEGFPNASEKRQQLRDFIYQGIVDIINNKDEILKLEQEISPIKEPTLSEFEIEPTAEENVQETNAQLVSGEAAKETFQANLVQYSDDPNSNIVDLSRYTYVKYNTITDPATNEVKYIVEVFNNQDLNKPFKNKEFTKEELKKEFNKQGLFFTDKINNNFVYLLLTANKKLINSFLLNNVINKQNIPVSSTLNTVNYQDLENQEGEIVLLNLPQYNNSFKTQEEFKNKASLGIVVDGQLVALIPALNNNNKNALLRNELVITGSKGNFSIEPFKVKIAKVKTGSIIFNQDTQPVINFMSNLPGFTSTLAYVGEINKVKQLINPFAKSNEERNLIIDASNLTKAGVYLILEKPNKNPIIIPLNTPSLKEYIGTIKPEQLANLKTFLSENLTFNSKKSIKDNYLNFLTQLGELAASNPKSGVLKNLYNAIPKTINDKPTSNKQIKNIANLKLNFNLDTLFDYLLDTLINLNEVTKQFYTIDVDSQNLYADNSVIVSYNKVINNAVIIDNKQSVEFFKDFSDDTFCD